jgi:hypothetical protein
MPRSFDGIDELEHSLDLGPAGEPQQTIVTRAYVRHGGAALSRSDRAQDIDSRDGCAEVV